MMDEAMRLSGAGYLRAVLRPTLAAVLAERRPCEIDPARVKPQAAISNNRANLQHYVEKVRFPDKKKTTDFIEVSYVKLALLRRVIPNILSSTLLRITLIKNTLYVCM